MRKEQEISGGIDWITVFLLLALEIIGWLTIVSVNYKGGHINYFSLDTQQGKQLLWVGISLVIGIAILITNEKFFTELAWIHYALMIALLVLVFFLAPEVKGAKSWFELGPFKFQPSEFAKFATCLALARYLTSLSFNMSRGRDRLIAFSIIFLPALLIVLQGDAGTALIFAGLVIVLYRLGFPVIFFGLIFYVALLFVFTIAFSALIVTLVIIILFSLAVIFLSFRFRINRGRIFLISLFMLASAGFTYKAVPLVFENVLEPHQQLRIKVSLGLEDDKDATYNVRQSISAIRSGGVTGKGFLDGTMNKGEHVPEQSTDYIFSNIGEEFGFMGTGITILLFVLLLMRLIALGERQRSGFAKVYAYAVTSILFMHFALNIAMAIGIFPSIGIPLPFISYGGSSLIGFNIMLFILLKLDARRIDILW